MSRVIFRLEWINNFLLKIAFATSHYLCIKLIFVPWTKIENIFQNKVKKSCSKFWPIFLETNFQSPKIKLLRLFLEMTLKLFLMQNVKIKKSSLMHFFQKSIFIYNKRDFLYAGINSGRHKMTANSLCTKKSNLKIFI